jgi:hypothetical protein
MRKPQTKRLPPMMPNPSIFRRLAVAAVQQRSPIRPLLQVLALAHLQPRLLRRRPPILPSQANPTLRASK